MKFKVENVSVFSPFKLRMIFSLVYVVSSGPPRAGRGGAGRGVAGRGEAGRGGNPHHLNVTVDRLVC